MSKIGIIGWGVVGQATGKGFQKAHDVLWHDPYKEGSTSVEDLVEHSEFLFVCVPTPMYSDHSGADLSIVTEAVNTFAPKLSGTQKVLTLKSTVVPGTTTSFAQKYPDVIFAFNPEFLTERTAEKGFLNPDRTLIGTYDKDIAERIKNLYEEILPSDSAYFISDPTTCELAKYSSNVILASKVILANEIYNIAKALDLDYDEVRKMIEADPRMGSNFNVPGPDGDFGFGGKCLPKDIVGFLGLAKSLNVDVSVFEAVWDKNLKIRKNQNWHEIVGAVSKKD
jgi:UDPglucose 6-dehydrogenase